MKLTLSLIGLVSTLVSVVSAVDVRGFTAYGCSGQQWVCYNIRPGICCGPFPRDIRSMRWTLPADTRGIGTVNKYCTWEFPAVYGPRSNSCWNYLGQPVRSARWQQGYCVWQWRRSILFERQDEKCAVAEGCAEPTVLIYTTELGAQRAVTIPAGGAETAAKYLESRDFKALQGFANFTGALDTKSSVDEYEVTALPQS